MEEYGNTPVVQTGTVTTVSGRVAFAGNLEQLELATWSGGIYFPTTIFSIDFISRLALNILGLQFLVLDDRVVDVVASSTILLLFSRLLFIETFLAPCLFLILFFRQNMILENRGLETKNNANTNQKFTFPDGSTVILEKNSSIIVSEDFGKVNRTVLLKGRGLFKVVRNEKKPFLVRMGNLVTEVLGTSFKVGADNQSKSIEVEVISGKVSVYASSNNGISKKLNGVLLTPNLKAVYNTENQTIQESIVEKPRLLVPNLQKVDFIFDEIQFGELRDRFKLFYGVDIIFVNKEIEKCLFTGDLGGLDLYKQLDVACTSINAKYELRGATIFINGKSCK
jgi:hypothetical protein